MLTQLQCPSCNAPLAYDGVAPTIQCPYCDSVVAVPEHLRTKPVAPPPAPPPPATAPRKPARRQPRPAPAAHDPAYTLEHPGARRRGCALAPLLLLIIAVAAVAAFFFAPATAPANVEEVIDLLSGRLPALELTVAEDATGGLATLLGRFGGEGIGPGKFEDARAIAVDNAGRLYVGEYGSGRIQVFDTEGAFQTQWRLGDNDFYVDQFAADRGGVLYIPFRGELDQYDGAAGALLGALPPVEGGPGGYQDSVAATAEGAVYAVWDDDIVRFNRSGALTLRIHDAIVAAVGGVETTTKLAVDGLGDIYALGASQDVVVKYDADGAFVDRVAVANRGAEDEPAKLRAGLALAVDSRGRVYVADIFGIKVYDGDGQHLGVIATPGVAFGLAIDDNDILYVAARTEVLRYQLQ